MTKQIGQKIGKLLIVRSAEPETYGGRYTRFWWCRCELCGNEERIPESKLSSVGCCSVCRRGPCVVCGGRITRNTRSNTCCDICHTTKRRGQQNTSYAKRSHENPAFNRDRHAALVARMKSDAALAARIRAVRRRASARYAQNPENRKKIERYQSQRYAENRAAIIDQRKRFFASLTLEQQVERREKQRGHWRKYQREYRQWLRDNPDEHRAFITRQRIYRTERQRHIELDKIRAATEILQDKLNDKP